MMLYFLSGAVAAFLCMCA